MARLTQFLSDDELGELISAFPEAEFAFAYGSGVVKQQVGTAQPLLHLSFAERHSEQCALGPNWGNHGTAVSAQLLRAYFWWL